MFVPSISTTEYKYEVYINQGKCCLFQEKSTFFLRISEISGVTMGSPCANNIVENLGITYNLTYAVDLAIRINPTKGGSAVVAGAALLTCRGVRQGVAQLAA